MAQHPPHARAHSRKFVCAARRRWSNAHASRNRTRRGKNVPGKFSQMDQAGVTYAVTEEGLLQTGGAAGDHGLAAPIRRGEGTFLYAFGPRDRQNLRAFAEHIDRSFLPRPQGGAPAIAVGNRHPEISLPAAFAAFE